MPCIKCMQQQQLEKKNKNKKTRKNFTTCIKILSEDIIWAHRQIHSPILSPKKYITHSINYYPKYKSMPEYA